MTSSQWDLYAFQPAFVIGFHGCDAVTGEAILRGESVHLKPSQEKWDWLGHGIYFWQSNPQRAFEWATERATKDKIVNPFVLGAIIDLRHCLDLLDSTGLTKVAEAHALVKASYATLGKPLPANIGGNDKAIRILDCLVINSLHDYRKTEKLVEYDSVRAAFPEGEELYADAGFKSKNHIQLCIRDKQCIKGYFRPIAS